jgi:hypothetical protein
MRCPICRAENAREPSCRRCKADLALLVALEQQRDQAIAASAAAAARGDAAEAVRQAQTAHQLRTGPDSAQALAVGHLLRRDFAAALAWHRRGTG